MINQLITWLRRDDDRLEPLRRKVQLNDDADDENDIGLICACIAAVVVVLSLGVIVATWLL